MLKVLGALLILAASAGFGCSKSIEMKRREKELEQFLQVLLCLSGEIRCQGGSLVDTFRNTAYRCGKCYSAFLMEAAECMESGTEKNLCNIIRKCAGRSFGKLHLTDEEKRKIEMLGERLGYLDREMQLRQLELYEEEFRQILSKLREEIPEKKKLYNSLGIMGGIMAAILFW